VWWYAALSWIGMKMLMLGMLIGSSLLFVGLVLHCVLKRWNNNKSFIYFQKVLVPLVVLMLVSLVLYVIKE
jgi:hypothetical protein